MIRIVMILALLLALGAAAILNSALAHPDDPKEWDVQPRYEGPAYRRDVNGLNPPPGFPSSGVVLQSWLPLGEFGDHPRGNDCWGYVSGSGREYAIIGLYGGTGFVDITNPGNAQIVSVLDGPDSTWRDIKTYQHYGYAVSEAGSGIQVFDLSQIDNGDVTLVRTVTGNGTNATHNVAIDTDSGFLYRCGGGANGLRIYDLAEPANPVFVGAYTERYVHDAQVVTFTSGPYAGRQIAFCCAGFNGGWAQTGLTIVDVTNKSNPQVLAHCEYPNAGYSHQGWLSPDRRYFYLDDEFDEVQYNSNTTTHVIDVSDLENPVQVNTFSSGTTSVDHNLYTRGNLIFEANYRSGVRVFDATDPVNPAQIAFFDTYPDDDDPSFNGLWSCYPNFPSGTVIGSDKERGLFVWTVSERQLRFEFPDGRPDVISPGGGTRMRVQVRAAAGQPAPGTGMLHIDTGGGFEATSMHDLGDDLYEAVFPPVTCGAEIRYYVSAETTGGDTATDPAIAPHQTYHATSAVGVAVVIADDFESDRGWTIVNEDVIDGAWERGVPQGDGSRGDPVEDFDGSGSAYVTGLRAGQDVDGGPTRLVSPTFDLSGMDAITVSYARWVASLDQDDGPNPGTDYLDIEVSNDGGATWTLVEHVTDSGGWARTTFRLTDHIQPTDQVIVRFSIADNPNNTVTEAAVDAFTITSVICGGAAELADLTVLDGTLIAGSIEDLEVSDDEVLELEARVTGEVHQPHLLRMRIGAQTDAREAARMDLTIESRITDVEATVWLSLRDWDAGQFVQVDSFTAGMNESAHEVTVQDAARFVRDADGRIVLEVKEVVFLPFTLNGFHALFDHVGMTLR